MAVILSVYERMFVESFFLCRDKHVSHSVLVICCARLPDRLIVTFPNGDEIKTGDKKPAGSTIGEHCVIIAISQFSLSMLNRLYFFVFSS